MVRGTVLGAHRGARPRRHSAAAEQPEQLEPARTHHAHATYRASSSAAWRRTPASARCGRCVQTHARLPRVPAPPVCAREVPTRSRSRSRRTAHRCRRSRHPLPHHGRQARALPCQRARHGAPRRSWLTGSSCPWAPTRDPCAQLTGERAQRWWPHGAGARKCGFTVMFMVSYFGQNPVLICRSRAPAQQPAPSAFHRLTAGLLPATCRGVV